MELYLLIQPTLACSPVVRTRFPAPVVRDKPLDPFGVMVNVPEALVSVPPTITLPFAPPEPPVPAAPGFRLIFPPLPFVPLVTLPPAPAFNVTSAPAPPFPDVAPPADPGPAEIEIAAPVFPAAVPFAAAPPAPPVTVIALGAAAPVGPADCASLNGIAVEPVRVESPNRTSVVPVAAEVSPTVTAVCELVVVAELKTSGLLPSAKVFVVLGSRT